MAALADLRHAYETQVRALRPIADAMLAADFADEVVARTMFAARDALKLFHKRSNEPSVRAEINGRNMRLYGWRDGPTLGELRSQYDTWIGAVDSACRLGGGDLRHMLSWMVNVGSRSWRSS